MENIERTQFVVLTGHLDEQPLPDLIRRLRVQRKSGRLQVEYAQGPAAFFFEDGQMVEARLGELRGVEALYAALELDGASFNFNPLVRPPERNIDRQGQQFIRDLVEAPRREGLAEIRVAGTGTEAQGGPVPLQGNAPRQLGPAPEELLAPLEERLSAVEGAIDTASRRFSRERLVYAVVISFLVGLSFITTLNIVYGPLFNGRGTNVDAGASPSAQAERERAGKEAARPLEGTTGKTASEATGKEQAGAAPSAPVGGATQTANANGSIDTVAETTPPVPAAAAVVGSRRFDGVPPTRREYLVEVLVEVRAGRVTDARVWNPRPGAAPFEAVALKMARERRYPEGFTGGERLRIRVKP